MSNNQIWSIDKHKIIPVLEVTSCQIIMLKILERMVTNQTPKQINAEGNW